jgi:hypothetical protein
MKNKLVILICLLPMLTAFVAANDYIIQDSNQNPLFVINESGEKQIQNGNILLNGNSIIDNQGPLTLGGGDVEIPRGGLIVNDSGGSDSLKVRSDYGQLNLVESDENDKTWRFEVTNQDFAFTESGVGTYIRANAGGPIDLSNANVRVLDGTLNMNGNEIRNVGSLDLGWNNITDYPTGCDTNEAVQVIGDTLSCTDLNPGGTVETGGGSEGQVAFFVDAENVTGSDNFYWNNSEVELGIGTNDPTATLDINGQTNLRSTLYMNGENINNPNLVDGVDLENPGNAISISGNQYQIGSGAIGTNEIGSNAVGTNELANNAITNTELDNSDSFNAAGLTIQGNAQVRGNLDVWGNVQNTDIENLNINGSLLPPSGYDATFDIGSSSRRWRDAYFSGIGQFDSGLTVSSGTVDIPSGEIDNSELANDEITTSTNSGINSESVNLGGDLTINHADTSSQGNIDNSGGTIIQDLSFDGFGHVTGQNSYNLDNRYYTESESDSNFVDGSGDTMTGDLTLGTNSLVGSGGSSIEFGANDDEDIVYRVSDPGEYEIYRAGTRVAYIQDNLVMDNGNLNMGGNLIANFFGNNCQSGEVVGSVNADGTYNCQSITGTADDVYVNQNGDTMTGDLNMQGNSVQNVGILNASTIQIDGNDIGGLFVDESGDSMSGNLNMQNHHIDNLAHLELNSGSGADIRVDGTDAIRMDGNQNVEIPNGVLSVNSDTRLSNMNGYTGSGRDSVLTNTEGSNHPQFRLLDGGSFSDMGFLIRSSTDGGSSWTEQLKVQGGNVEIPNGQVQLSSAKVTGVATPTNAQDAANKDYVDSAQDAATQTLSEVLTEGNSAGSNGIDMSYNSIDNVGSLNVSTSGDQIARFSNTGITLSQPLSVESSGPLSVGNGIDLTGPSSNTIESYSTMYLQTSSGSPSDIVLDPTGEVGVATNLSVTGYLDMQDGPITNVDWSNSNQGSGSSLNADMLDGVELASINWGDTSMAQSDVSLSDIGAADTDLDMNEYDISGVDQITIPDNGDSSGKNLLQIGDDVYLTDIDSGNTLGIQGIQENAVGNIKLGSAGPTLSGTSSGNLDLNGNLNVNNQLTVGSTVCNTGQYIDGDGSCTSVTGETSGEYVNEAGDTMTGDLNMNSNSLVNVGSNNIDIGDGQGNIAMNGQRILESGLIQASGIGVTDSLSTAETEVSGNSIYVQGDVSVDGDFVGAGADVAENIRNQSRMESGTVVKISGNMSVDKTDEARDTAVAGVVSRDPAMVMAKERDGVPIAMTGTVPVKFSNENGGVKPGDMLTSASMEGYAMKCKEIVKCQGSIIGKAMQTQMDTGEVQMLISRG